MRAVLIAVAGAISFVAVFLGTWVVGVWMNTDAECDGVCVDMFGIIGALAVVLGVLGGLVGGWAAAAAHDRLTARRSPA